MCSSSSSSDSTQILQIEHKWKSGSHIKLTPKSGFPVDNSDSALTKLIEIYFHTYAPVWSQLPVSTSCSKEALQLGFF